MPPPVQLRAILSYWWRELVVVVPDNRRRQKRGVRVTSAPNPRLSRANLANETARAAEREGTMFPMMFCMSLENASNAAAAPIYLYRDCVTTLQNFF
jgi:hypothetical protein